MGSLGSTSVALGSKSTPYWVLAPAIATIVACLTVFARLGAHSVWLDEGYSIAFARLDWPTLWIAIHHLDASETLYYALLHLWLAVGTSVVALRALSAIFAIASVPLVFALARRFFDARTAAIAALFLAVNSFFVQHAQAVSPYGIVLFLASATMLSFERLLAQPGPTKVALFVSSAALLVYIHATGLLLLVALAASLFVRKDRTSVPWRHLAVAALVLIVLIAPFVFFVAHGGGNRLAWITRPHRLIEMVGIPLFAFAGSKIFALLCSLSIIVAIASAVRARSWEPVATLLTWLVVPIVLLFAESEVGKPLFISRYVVYSLVPFLILVARGITAVRNPVAMAVITLGMLILSGAALRTYYRSQTTDYRGAARYVTQHARGTDGVIVYDDDCATTYRLALAQANLSPEPLVYPPMPCSFWLDRPPIVAGDVKTWSSAYVRLWLVMRGYETKPVARTYVEEQLGRGFRKTDVVNFESVSVVRFERRQ